MKKLLLPLLFGLFALISTLNAQDTLRVVLHFENDSHQLEKAEQAKLKRLFYNQKPDFIHIEGHTDGRASDSYNKALAQRRVTSVRKALEKLGLNDTSLQSEAWGESKPIASNATEAGRARNRRVEVFAVIMPVAGPATTIADLYRKLGYKPQVFWLPGEGERDTILHGRNGVRLLVQGGSFRCDEQFDYTVPIRFELKEYLEPDEMLMGNLHSMSGGNLLQTDGMLHILAFQGEHPLTLCEDRPIAFFVPSEEPMDSMYHFQGVTNDFNALDWEQRDLLNVRRGRSSIVSDNGSVDDTIFNRVHIAATLADHLYKLPRYGPDNTFQRMVKTARDLKGIPSFYTNNTTNWTYSEEMIFGGGNIGWAPTEGTCVMWDYDPITGEAYAEDYEDFTRYVDNPEVICDTIPPLNMNWSAPQLSTKLQGLVAGATGYLGQTANMGPINCDRFLQGGFQRRIEVITNVSVDSMTDVKLLLPGIKGIMYSYSRFTVETQKSFAFRGVPNNLRAVLLGLRYEEGKAYIAISKFRINSLVQELTFKPIKERQIADKLAELGF